MSTELNGFGVSGQLIFVLWEFLEVFWGLKLDAQTSLERSWAQVTQGAEKYNKMIAQGSLWERSNRLFRSHWARENLRKPRKLKKTKQIRENSSPLGLGKLEKA